MKAKPIIKKLKSDGYFIWDQFLEDDQAVKLRNKLEKLLKSNKNSSRYWADKENSDNRIYGIDRIDKEFIEIFDTENINNVIIEYLNIDRDSIFSFVLGNRLIAKTGNKGSGGGWHRDTFAQKQLKFIIYLSDVSKNNGPFTFAIGSHKIQSKLADFLKRPRRNMRRYPKYSTKNTIELTGKLGTLLIVDTSGVHRGKPIEENSRYALTLYLNKKDFSPSLKKRINDKE